MTERVVVGELPVGAPSRSSRARCAGATSFLSGRAPIDTTTMQVVSDDFGEQARSVLDQIMRRSPRPAQAPSRCSASSATCCAPGTSASGTASGPRPSLARARYERRSSPSSPFPEC